MIGRRPFFSLHNVVRGYSVDACDAENKVALIELLQGMSRRTWLDLKLGRRQGTGFEKIAHASIRVGIPDCLLPDATILSIRISQRSRLIGFREQDIFHVVWIDPQHTVYDG